MRRTIATIVAFLLAPLVPSLILAIMSPLRIPWDAGSMLSWTFVFYFYSGLATLLFALPAYLVFRRFNLINLWSVMSSGLLIGAIVAIVLRLPDPIPPVEVIRMAAIGGAAALVFLLIWRQGFERKDRSGKPSRIEV